MSLNESIQGCINQLTEALGMQCGQNWTVRSRWVGVWCLFGDFNVIRYPVERLGCNSFRHLCLNSQILLQNICRLICVWWEVNILGFKIMIFL